MSVNDSYREVSDCPALSSAVCSRPVPMYPESSWLMVTMAEKVLRGGIVGRLREWEVGEERWEGLLGREERWEGRGEGRAETVLEASMSTTASCVSYFFFRDELLLLILYNLATCSLAPLTRCACVQQEG